MIALYIASTDGAHVKTILHQAGEERYDTAIYDPLTRGRHFKHIKDWWTSITLVISA